MTNKPSSTINLEELTSVLLTALDARSKDIVTRRYGLKTGEAETLESIGEEYGITRERVRQIQSQAKKALTAREDLLNQVKDLFRDVFHYHGGVMAQEHAVSAVQESVPSSKPGASFVVFFLDLLPPYSYITRHSHFAPHWQHPDMVSAEAIQVIETAEEVLKKSKHPIQEADLMSAIRQAMSKSEEALPNQHIYAYLTASQRVRKTSFGEWGLVEWSETNPRGVGDKAYAVLRRHGKPEHFTAITSLINEAHFDHKQANPQTVHNELIKDKRFVLVGRGVYGLGEWGYMPGTVADVIESLLRDANSPLSRDEIVNRVLAQRQVKKNTILLGLQNQKRFVRTGENRYTIKK